jgi:hypothetical protein
MINHRCNFAGHMTQPPLIAFVGSLVTPASPGRPPGSGFTCVKAFT